MSRDDRTRLESINFFNEGPIDESKLFVDKFNVVNVSFDDRVIKSLLTASDPILLFDKSSEINGQPFDNAFDIAEHAGVEIDDEFKFK